MSRTIGKIGFDSFERNMDMYSCAVDYNDNKIYINDDEMYIMPLAQATSSSSYDTVASVSAINNIGDQLKSITAAIEELKKERVVAFSLSGLKRSELKTLNRGRNI